MKKFLKVYAVLEHAKGQHDARLHGVYRSKGHANAKQAKVELKAKGYVAVLRMTVRDMKLWGKK